MRGCGRSCLLQLGVWLLLATGLGIWLRSQRDGDPQVWLFAAGAALLGAIALSLIHTISVTARERRLLLTAGSLQTLEDGAWTVVSGEIRARIPARSPFSDQDVVAYDYSIHRTEGTGKHRSEVTYYDGKALAASVIATPNGAVRLLTVPTLDLEHESIETQRAIGNATRYLRSATFASRDTGAERTAALEAEWTDDDGSFRIDKRHFTAEIDLRDAFDLDERIVQQGEQVCAFGTWSAERGGLVPDTKWGRQCRVMRGKPAAIAASLGGRMLRYAFFAILLAGGAAGVAMAYLHQ